MSVTLRNTGGSVRVIYGVDGRTISIPPNASVDVVLPDAAVNRMQVAMARGDKLIVEKHDPIQPLDEVDMPPMKKEQEVSGAQGAVGLKCDVGSECPEVSPAPERPTRSRRGKRKSN